MAVMTRQTFEFEVKDYIVTCVLTLDVDQPDHTVGYNGGVVEISDIEVESIEGWNGTLYPDAIDGEGWWSWFEDRMYDWIMEHRFDRVCEEFNFDYE